VWVVIGGDTNHEALHYVVLSYPLLHHPSYFPLHPILENPQHTFVPHFESPSFIPISNNNGPQWPRGLRRGSAAARLLGLRVRIPPEAWMSVFCQYCVLSGRGLCDRLITRPEKSYRVWCVSVIAKPGKGRPWPGVG
jgi:hypothetical protein